MNTRTIVHPSGHVEVHHMSDGVMHHQPGGSDAMNTGAGAPNMENHATSSGRPMPMSPAPGSHNTGVSAWDVGKQGMTSDPMATGMRHAMDTAMSQKDAPIQKNDSKRGGTEDKRNAAPQADANVSATPAPIKAPKSKTVPGKGKNVKNTETARDKK